MPMQARMIDVGEVRLHVVTAGESGPPVVLLHGFPSYWGVWRNQIGHLAAAGYRVIVPDMRGYNLSEKPCSVNAYAMDHLTGDIIGLVRALGHERVALVGHDWGAVVAWCVAMHYPHAVDRMVVMNVTHPGISRRKFYTWNRLKKWWYMLFFQLPVLPDFIVRQRAFIERALRGIAGRPDAFTVDDVKGHLDAIRQPGAATAALNYYRAGFRRPMRPGASRGYVKAPTLLLWGEKDRLLGDDLLENIEMTGDEIRVMRLPGVGHWPQIEAPDQVNSLLLQVLSRQRVSPASPASPA